MAAGYEATRLPGTDLSLAWQPLVIGVAASALSAYLCIHWFLKLLDRVGMLPFVIYRLLLGALLLWLFA